MRDLVNWNKLVNNDNTSLDWLDVFPADTWLQKLRQSFQTRSSIPQTTGSKQLSATSKLHFRSIAVKVTDF